MNKLLILGMLLFASLSSVAQKRYTISGTVTDKATGESLIGATVSVEGTHEGTVTNEYGFFSISLPAASYTIYASYIGYTRYAEKLVLNQDYKLKVALAAEGNTLQEVVVSDKAQNEAVTSAQMGRENLNVKQLASLPVLFGEKDVMKIVQLLPGVKAAGEGSTGFYVRGARPTRTWSCWTRLSCITPHTCWVFSPSSIQMRSRTLRCTRATSRHSMAAVCRRSWM